MKSTLGTRLKELRDEYRLSQTAFADRVGISYVAYANIERGVTEKPQESTLESIVKQFGTTYEWLQEGRGKMLPNGKVELLSEGSVFDPARDTLYKELKEQIEFLKEIIRAKPNFRLALNHTGLTKERRLRVRAA